MTIIPLGKRLLIKLISQEQAPKPGALIIPDSAKGKDPHYEVIAEGDEIEDEYIGCHVMVEKYTAREVTIDGETLYIVHEKDVMAIVD